MTQLLLFTHIILQSCFHCSKLSVLFSYQGNLASSTLDTILSIQPKDSSSGGGETRESIVRRQAGEMLEKLPADYIPHEVVISPLSSPATSDCLPPSLPPLQVKTRLAKMGAIAPINIFLRQEIDRMQRVISNVRSTLQDLQLAIDGTIIMSEVGVALPSHACTLLCRHIKSSLSCFHNLYRISVMPWTVYMMPRFPRRGER